MNPSKLCLDATAGRAAGSSFVVHDRLVIGRDSDAQGRLADDPELSRHHAEIARAQSGEFTITDLSSTNGTFVNGTRLNAAAVLAVGDEIEVGGTRLVVRSAPVAEAPAPVGVDVRAATISVPAATREPAERGEAPQPVASRQPFEVRLTVDFEQEIAQLSVYGAGEPIRLELEDGRWRVRGGTS